jgi:hypothetical protein
MVKKRNAYRLLVGKPEGRRLLGRPIHRCVDNIRMDLGEVGWGGVDWIGLAQGIFVSIFVQICIHSLRRCYTRFGVTHSQNFLLITPPTV